jgi:hypothetical protein
LNKTTKKPKKTNARQTAAAREYERLIDLYTAAGVDEIKLKINDSLIKKVSEIYGILEAIKDLPTIKIINGTTVETGAGKARVKYMAQYTASTIKLNRDLMGVLGDPYDDTLSEFE